MSGVEEPTQEYYSMADLGYYNNSFVTPRMALDILMIPEIWDHMGASLIMSTFGWFGSSTLLGAFLPPLMMVTTSFYVHYVVWLLKEIELDPKVNVAELKTLES